MSITRGLLALARMAAGVGPSAPEPVKPAPPGFHLGPNAGANGGAPNRRPFAGITVRP